MAEGLFRKMTEEDESSFEIQSAGVATGGGQEPSKYTLDILKEEGIDLSSNKSQFLERVGESSLPRAANVSRRDRKDFSGN